jgi:glycosyltransferase involved in cell wall biosynthesis
MTTGTRIAIFLPSLYGGGAERVMVTLANGFAERGLTVDLVVARAHGVYGAYTGEISPKVRLVVLGRTRLLAATPALVKYLVEQKPQAMLSAINMANIVAIAARAIAGTSTRLVISERNMNSGAVQTGDFRDHILPYLMRLTYRHADAITAVSAAVAGDVAQVTGLERASIEVIHNPLDVAGIAARSQETVAFPKELGRPLIVAAGRLDHQKDYPTLIAAFALLAESRPATLVILGEGKLRGEIEAMIAARGLTGRVHLPGFAVNPFAFMARADLFVLSSAWEGFGNVLVEAMACGARVVATDCPGGIAEVLEAGKWGALVPVGDPEALAAAMMEALDDGDPPDVRQRAAHFATDHAIDRYLDLLTGDEAKLERQ